MNAQQVILHLSLIPHVGPATIGILLKKCKEKDQLLKLYQLRVQDFINHFNLSERLSLLIEQGLRDTTVLDEELRLLERHRCSYVTILDDTYPSQLKQIYLPPSVLYFSGTHPHGNERTMSFVGSRAAGGYAQRVIDHLVPPLVSNGWTIVSGGAVGVDSMAHAATLKARGKTIVVLGSGLLRPYPRSNERLFDSVRDAGGMLMSSFALTQSAQAGNFPARNRIIAGLSRGTVVVQAAAKSGALITAQFALEQGREVFAVPGQFDDPLSEGCHRLIQQGAKLVHSVDDILVEFGQQAPAQEIRLEAVISNYEEPSDETGIVKLCQTPASVDDLLVATGLALSELQEALLMLQLEGKLEQQHNGMWQKIA